MNIASAVILCTIVGAVGAIILVAVISLTKVSIHVLSQPTISNRSR